VFTDCSPIATQKSGVTHIVCKNLSGSKTEQAAQNTKSAFKIVNAKWIYDSIAARQRRKETEYAVVPLPSGQQQLHLDKKP
jgi:hypothetical protein